MLDEIPEKCSSNHVIEHGDIVLSSRVRLARNLIDYPFPSFINKHQEKKIQEEILAAFSRLPGSENFTILQLDALSSVDKKILLERNLITEGYSLGKDKVVVLSEDESVSTMICENDHIRLSCIKEGMVLEDVYGAIDGLDTLLEGQLHYAASMEWGYLSGNFRNLGTGMRASIMVHLPALVMTSLIERALKAVSQVGLGVKGFFAEGSSSLGNVYQLSNQVSIGMDEMGILSNLENVSKALIEYERKARNELLQKERMKVEDTVFRALGVLTNCRSISSREAIELLSQLRWGVSMDLITGIPLSVLDRLFFLTQKHHVQKSMGQKKAGDTMDIDGFRAAIIRESLNIEMGGA